MQEANRRVERIGQVHGVPRCRFWMGIGAGTLIALSAAVLSWGQVPALPEDGKTASDKESIQPFDEPEVQWTLPGIFTLPGGATMQFVWIAPGSFLMGSPRVSRGHTGWGADEMPSRQVTISRGFWLGKYEVTQGQWASVMGTRPWAGREQAQDDPDGPAVYLSWQNVQDFIRTLNEAEGREVYRLPTEAEWEYACRAGTTSRWSFGDDARQLGDYAWYKSTTPPEKAKRVGQKQPNSWGLYDLHGNVWEWVQDWYGEYAREAQDDPTGPAAGLDRVVRGGSFTSWEMLTRSATRRGLAPPSRHADLGVRLVRVR
jgi:formylglycine-generating enzyme required for sulfatase activity